MHSFKDTTGIEWKLSLNVYTLEKVREGAEVLLTEVADQEFKLLIQLHTDPILLVKVIWSMIEDQADELKVTPKQFAQAMGGDALTDAVNALVRAIDDFFTNPVARDGLATLMEKAQAMTDRIHELAKKELKENLATLDIDQLARNYIDSVTSSRESADNTQELTPTANSV